MSSFFHLSILLYILFSITCHSETITSLSGDPIIIGESLLAYDGFFNSLTIPNVAITSDSDEFPTLNFYIIGGNLTSNSDITSFIQWTTTNECSNEVYGVDHSEYNVTLPSSDMDIYYRCGLVIESNINITLSLQFVLDYEVYMAPYRDLTWIIEIMYDTDGIEFSVSIPADLWNDYNHPQFWVDTDTMDITIRHSHNFIYTFTQDCPYCRTLPDQGGGDALWDTDNIYVNNSKNFWLFTQSFLAKEVDIGTLLTFNINMKCVMEYDFIPHLIGLDSLDSFTRELLEQYMTNQVSWPSPHYDSGNGLKVMTCMYSTLFFFISGF